MFRAELLVHEDPTMAVTNLTQAIKIQPNNADIYLRRAKLYQDRQQVKDISLELDQICFPLK